MTSMTSLADLKVKIFADGADRGSMLELYRNPIIKGFTTNPTLMRNAGINGLRGVRTRYPQGHPRPADLAGSLLGRLRRDGVPGPSDRVLGRKRLRQDPGDQHSG